MAATLCPHCGHDLNGEPFQLGKLFVDRASAHVWWGDRPVQLTASERLIVVALAKADGAIIRRHVLAEVIGNDTDDPSNTIAVFISRIRAKFRAIDSAFDLIENVWGQGIRWRVECSAS